MFAVVYFGGKQYKVREKDELEVEKIELEPGKNFKINEVLLLAEEDGSLVKVGMPFVLGTHVECQVMGHGKGEKIRVFKFKAKKRYQRTQGHRQRFTTLKVLKISALEKKAQEKVAKVIKKVIKKKSRAKKAVLKKAVLKPS